MKKKLTFITAMCIAVCGIAGCGNNQPAATTTAATAAPAATEATTTAAETTAPETEATEAVTTSIPSPEVEGTVLYDSDGVKITYKGFRYCDEYDGGAMLELGFGNNTGEELHITPYETSINKRMYQVEPIIIKPDGTFEIGSTIIDIPAGEITDTYGLYLAAVPDMDYTLDNIGETSFSFEIMVGDDWEHAVNTELYTVENPDVTEYSIDYDDSGEVVYDKDDIKIVVCGTDFDSIFWGSTVKLYVYNGSDRSINISVPTASLNGEEHECFAYLTVAPDCHLYDELLFDNALEIETLKTFSASFEIEEFNTWNNGELIDTSDPVTVEF